MVASILLFLIDLTKGFNPGKSGKLRQWIILIVLISKVASSWVAFRLSFAWHRLTQCVVPELVLWVSLTLSSSWILCIHWWHQLRSHCCTNLGVVVKNVSLQLFHKVYMLLRIRGTVDLLVRILLLSLDLAFSNSVESGLNFFWVVTSVIICSRYRFSCWR